MSTAPHSSVRNLASILVEAGVVSEQQVQDGLARQLETGRRIGETLVEMGAVTEEDIGWALSRQLALTFVDVRPGALDRDLVQAFPEPLLRRLQAVPLVQSEEQLSVAVADPTDVEAIAELVRVTPHSLALCVATPSSIRIALDAIFGARPEERAQHADSGTRYDVLWDRSGASFLKFHVATALKHGFTEIHFLPEADQLHVHYRSQGLLEHRVSEPIEVLEYLLARLEALGGPALRPGDVHRVGYALCPLPYDHPGLEVSLLRGASGVAVTVSLRPERWRVPGLVELGLEPVLVAQLRAALEPRAGLVVVCGPNRAGGSTTVASLVTEAVPSGLRTLVFETRPTIPYSTATCVHLEREQARAAWEEISVAQSADVVVLDDVLTAGSIGAVLSPAASGRLLIVRTDWCDTFGLLDHLMGRPGARTILSHRLLAVLQQRLVRTGQPPGEPDPDVFPGDRSGLFEVFLVTDAIRHAIQEGRRAEQLAALAAAGGFQTLAHQARERVAVGALTAAEAARALS